MNRGVCYIAFGANAKREAKLSMETLGHHHNSLPTTIVGKQMAGMNNVQQSRWAKVNLYGLSPFDQTLYLDADTRVRGDLSAGWQILADGFDIVLTASNNQGSDIMWHVGDKERETTLLELAHLPVQLQGGVFFFRRNARTRAFFQHWRDEWSRWKDQDQGALLRALNRSPVKTWLLGRPWNGGAVITHLFGRAKE